MQKPKALSSAVIEELAGITDSILYAVDAEGLTAYLNPAAMAALEIPPGESASRRFTAYIHEDDRKALHRAFREALGTPGAVLECEARLVGSFGRTTPCLHRVKQVSDAEECALVGVARNISDLKRLEEQLQQSQKLESIGLLTGGIAHDFNNMLAAILGYTELALEEKTEDDPDWRALNYVKTSTERAAALARQLLMFGRRSRPELKPLAVTDLVQETLSILERTLPRNIAIHIEPGDRGEHIVGDRTRLQQALINLCLNARDAMPDGGDLTISVDRIPAPASSEVRRGPRRAGECIRLSVRDTGTGIPSAALKHLWEPFFTTKPSGAGTGLGLPVVRRIVRSHGGDVEVETMLGQGTTFSLYLPAVSHAAMDAVAALSEPPGGNENILVVDDEPVLLSLVSDILISKGYHVVTASGGEEALDAIAALGGRLHLVISDSMMPGMSGKELSRRVRSERPELPIIVCSGHGQARHPTPEEARLVSAYVHKPYQRRELLTRVREVLDRDRSLGTRS